MMVKSSPHAPDRYEVYRSGLIFREWRWRLIAINGKVVAEGGEGYHNRLDCYHGISIVKLSADTRIVEYPREAR